MKWLKEKGLLVLFVVLALVLVLTPMAASAEDIAAEHSIGNGTQAPARSVTVRSTLEKTIQKGETFYLIAELEGYDDCSYFVRWEYNDGFGWTVAPNSNTLKFAVKATEATVNFQWRFYIEETQG